MKFFKSLFREPPPPEKMYHHDLLGNMQFVEDDEAWVGVFNGLRVSVAYEGASEPDPWLMKYGMSLVEDRPWLEAEIE